MACKAICGSRASLLCSSVKLWLLPFRLPTALEFDFDAALFDDEGDVVADIPKIWGVDDELLIDILIPDSYFVMVAKVNHVDDLAV